MNIKNKKEVSLVKKKISLVEEYSTSLIIKNQKDLGKGIELLRKIKMAGKMLKNTKERITKPANEILKNAREIFRPLEQKYIEAEKIVKEKMLKFNEIQTELAEKKEERIVEKVEDGKMSFEKASEKINANAPKKTVETKGGAKIQFRVNREVIIEDATKLPRNYLVPHTAKIRKDALSGIEIPGVKVVEKKLIASM